MATSAITVRAQRAVIIDWFMIQNAFDVPCEYALDARILGKNHRYHQGYPADLFIVAGSGSGVLYNQASSLM